MKSFLINFNLCTLFLLFNVSSAAQGLSVIPNQANTDDSISVIAEVIFGKNPCPLGSFSISIVDSTIKIDANYLLGFGNGSCKTSDTLMIGKLKSRLYKLIFYAKDSTFMSSPLIDSISFKVNQITGILELNNPIQSISVYPNPSKEAINLKLKLAKAISTTIRITDVQGKIVYINQFQLFKGESIQTIPTANISSGIYSLSLWEGEKLLKEEKLVVQH